MSHESKQNIVSKNEFDIFVRANINNLIELGYIENIPLGLTINIPCVPPITHWCLSPEVEA